MIDVYKLRFRGIPPLIQTPVNIIIRGQTSNFIPKSDHKAHLSQNTCLRQHLHNIVYSSYSRNSNRVGMPARLHWHGPLNSLGFAGSSRKTSQDSTMPINPTIGIEYSFHTPFTTLTPLYVPYTASVRVRENLVQKVN
jgi:hypothetical protein